MSSSVTPTDDATGTVYGALQEKLLGDTFSCVAGKTALQRSTLVHRHFGPMGDPQTTADLYAAAAAFTGAKDEIDLLLATFVATFEGPLDVDEVEFERLLWTQLQALHEIDARSHTWAEISDADPASPRFGFSIAEHAFFIVGMHANSSRMSRQFAYPTMVFNSHIQFERLKERGIYGRIQHEVRVREIALQGLINPNLSNFGERSEAAQYSGRAAPADWRCPFRPDPGTVRERT